MIMEPASLESTGCMGEPRPRSALRRSVQGWEARVPVTGGRRKNPLTLESLLFHADLQPIG